MNRPFKTPKLQPTLRRMYWHLPASARRHLTPFIAMVISNSALLGRIPILSNFTHLKREEYLFKKGKFHEALTLLERRSPLQTRDIRLLDLFAETSLKVGNFDQGSLASTIILQIDPFHIRSAKRLNALSKPYTANQELIQRYLSENNSAENFAKVAEFCLSTGKIRDCIEVADQGLQIADHEVLASSNQTDIRAKLLLHKGHALLLDHRREEAQKHLEAVPWSTSSYGRAAMLRARIMMENDDPDSAISIIEDQYKKNGKDVGFNNTYFPALLRKNRIKDAFLSYRLRRESAAVAKLFRMPPPGKSLKIDSEANKRRKALFISEGGPGDEIRFASFYPCLGDSFGSVSITCDPRLESVLVRTFPDIRFISTARYRKDVPGIGPRNRSGIKDPALRNFISEEVLKEAQAKDVVCTVLDTLGELRAERNDFRRQRTRFAVDADLDAHWKRQLKGRANLQVGLAWRSLLSSPDRDRHYLKVEDLSQLSRVKDVDFWILQAGVTDEELQYLSERLNIIVPDVDLKDDFEGQAALLANLDVTISPLTTMAELAGMVDCRTLIFCRTPEAIWRRNDDGTDVWYDNARLVAGEPIHDTEALMKSLVEELQGIQQELCPTYS